MSDWSRTTNPACSASRGAYERGTLMSAEQVAELERITREYFARERTAIEAAIEAMRLNDLIGK